MLGAQANREAWEEGFKAARQGKAAHDNPYDFRYETRAWFWEDGFKKGSK